MIYLPNYYVRVTVLAMALLGAGGVLAGAKTATPSGTGTVASAAVPAIARVGDSVITEDEYRASFDVASRGKFYHGKPPENEIALMQREVIDKMVARIVLLQEANRRGLKPDTATVQSKVQGYEQRYASSAQWKNSRDKVLPPLIERLEQEDLLSQLEDTVRSSVKVNEKQAQAYYAAHQEQFTEPEQTRVSLILLKVDPSAPGATWKKAEEQVQALAKRARAGEDFATLARQHSEDGSASQGGDMGYLHSGMLPDGAQEVVSKLKNTEISDATRLLEGFAVFRMSDRKSAKLHGFQAVKVRAQELAQREQSNATWTAFVANLKKKADIQIDQSRFLPLAK